MSNLSRRSPVTSAAALPALAVPAVAIAAIGELDPIFVALERWKEALAAEDAGWNALGNAQQAFRNRHGSYYPGLHQTNDYEANVLPAEVACERASDKRHEAMEAVFKTVPTTLGGMRAKIDFAMSVDHVTESLTNAETTEPLGDFLNTL